MTITIFVKIRSDEMAPIRKEKKESITAGSIAFGFKVGKLLLKGYCWKKQMGTSITEIRTRVSKSTEIRYIDEVNSHLIFAAHICLQI